MKIHLSKLHRPLWHGEKHIHCRGHLVDAAGKLYENQQLANLFQRVRTANELELVLKDVSGHFAIIIELRNETLAAVDHAATIPLYYGSTMLSDDALAIETTKSISDEAKKQYLLSGYLIGNQTLYSDVKIIPAGSILSISKEEASIFQYYSYSHQERDRLDDKAMFDLLDQAHHKAIQRLIQYAAGRQIAIPLSGGYDSRLIAILLKQYAYKNLLCFSYGNPRSRESHISKAVAAYLDIPRHFITQKAKDWFNAYQSQERIDYYQFCGMIGSRPYLQDWLAIKELKAKGLLSSDAIIVPGHSGDFIQGTTIPAAFTSNLVFDKQAVAKQIYKQLYRLWPHSEEDCAYIKEQISSHLKLPDEMSNEEAAGFLEQFIWQHHQAKYYLNGTLLYEFFGFGWALPWWDKELLQFWRTVPLKERFARKLYKRYVQERQKLDIPVFYKQYLPIRALEWFHRKTKGYGYDPRWHRFADLKLDKDAQVGSLNPKQIKLPDFIDPKRRIADCDINGLQALVSFLQIYEQG